MDPRWQLNCDKASIFTAIAPLTVGVALITAIAAPVSAQFVLLNQGMPIGVVQPHAPASYIYGSSIPTPTLVDPTTGLLPSTNYSNPGYSDPGRGTVVDSTLINPTLVNPTIQNSTLINPVIVNDQFYQTPVYRTRGLGRSGIIFSYP